MEKRTYVGAYGIIIKNGKVILIKKAGGAYINKLDIPGGRIEHGENPCETLKRETMEEAGIEVINYKLFDTTAVNTIWEKKKNVLEDFHHVGILFIVKCKGRLKKEPDGIDSNGSSWYKIENLKKNDLTPFAAFSLEKLGYKLK